MKFQLVDRIDSIEPGKRIVTTKALTLAEEYLADHFPAFPVMPGVLMLEALVQSAAWLVRLEQDFANSVVVLGAARNVRYANFVQPGRKLRCELDALSIDADTAKFKGVGMIDDDQAVSARLELKCFNLAGRSGYLADADKSIINDLKKQFELVGGPAALAAAGS
ncbi:MAG: 3-hydroxyacyl-ACP dehydratase FabZ family protein [Phycisphaerae bacterium]|nr:3-hydroxyacyl-ACP dehydratase FabZ family protein [Phycisphaerae bacterium]